MTKNENRCVVTGLGTITAIGNNVEETWKNILAGVSGIKETKSVDTENCYANLAAEVHDDTLDNVPGAERMDRTAKLCVKAAGEAMRDAGLTGFSGDSRVSCIMGSCVGGGTSVDRYYRNGKEKSDITKMTMSAVADEVAFTYGVGGVVTNIANACAAGTMSIAYACDLIRAGKADVVLAGGADSFSTVPYAGFLSLHALSEEACSPFNHCKGITLGEGSGVVVVESYEHACRRNARVYCEVLGSGISTDAFHITAPRPDGEGQELALRRALSNSGLQAEEIGYVNAHGTGTAKNDEAEFLVLHRVFDDKNDNLSVSSTKSMTGHCLGAAGSIEAVISIKSLTEGTVPPTIGFSDEDLENLKEKAGRIDFRANVPCKKDMKYVMSNSFAFGGNDASIIFSKEAGNVQVPEEKENIYMTGFGIVSPLGNGVDNYIEKAKAFERLSENSVRSNVAGPDYEACGLKMSFYRKLDKISQIQAVSGMNALQNAGITVTDENAPTMGIAVGTGDGPLSTICDYQSEIVRKGNAAGSAFKFPNTVYNAAGGYLSICSGIKGYNVTVTNGSQSGLSSMAYAVNVMRNGQEKIMLTGGTDENSEIMTELYDGLGYLRKDGTDGIQLSDGSTSIILENESSVKERNAEVYAKVSGYGMACHPVAFGTLKGSGDALMTAAELALSDAGMTIDQIDLVMGMADGMKAVDDIERTFVNHLFGDRASAMPVVNIRHMTGEGRAAAAALSAVHASLILHGDLGESVKADFYKGNSVEERTVSVKDVKNIMVIANGTGGVYTAVIISGSDL